MDAGADRTNALKRVVLGQLGWSYDNAVYYPLSAAMLAASAKADPEVRGCYEIDPYLRYTREDPETIVREMELDGCGPDVLGLSMYVWCEQITLEVARLTKQRWPDCLVVLGGPSVSGWEWRTPEALLRQHRYVDYAIDGEGEHTFVALLKALADPFSEDKHANLKAVVYVDGDDDYIQGDPCPRERDLFRFPSPFLDGTLDAVLEHGRRKGVRFEGVWEASRGCPFQPVHLLYVGLGGWHQDDDVPARPAPRRSRVDCA